MPIGKKRTHRQFGIAALIVVLILAGSAISPVSPVHACDFEKPPPPEEALEEANAVFSGEAVSIEEAGEYSLEVTFAIDAAWKGTGEAEVSVRTDRDEGACGFPFEEGESYLVYAHGDATELTTALYNRTSRLDRADEDLEALGSGAPVVEPDEQDTEETDSEAGTTPTPEAWLLAGGALAYSFVTELLSLIGGQSLAR